jgi:hypothetical protein
MKNVMGLLCGLLTVSALSAAEFYVAPKGDDGNPGTIGEPFATIEAARDAIRSRNITGEDVTVWIRGGVYPIHETIVFGLEDSAPDGHRITYAAYPGEHPVLTSADGIRGWRKLTNAPASLPAIAHGQVWVADVPKGDAWRFRTLYDGEKLLPRARSAVFATTQKSVIREERWLDLRNIHFPPGTLKNWSNLEDVEILVRPNHVWVVNYLGLDNVDEDADVARTSAPSTYTMTNIAGRNGVPHCWVENVLEALDEPGEWVLNTREGNLYYWPESGKPGNFIVAPTLRELIRVEGTNVDALNGDVPVRGLTFKGLTLTCGDRDVWTLADKGIQHDWEMWDKDNSLLRFRGAEDCIVERCEFRNSSGGGIRIDRYGQRIQIVGNNIHDLGGTALLLCGYGPGLKDVNKGNLIINNNIQTCSQIHWHNPGIFVWQSGENKILNNRIHDLPYDGIVLSGVRPRYFGITDPVKWTIPDVIPLDIRENMLTIRHDEVGNPQNAAEARKFAHARNNLVQDNELNDCMQTLGDGNAIYYSCAAEGNTVRRNLVHHCARAAAQIRFDDDQEESTVAENIIFGPGIYLKHNNYVYNNILIDGDIRFRKETEPGSRVARNILYQTNDKLPFYDVAAPLEKLGIPDRNLFYARNEMRGKAEFADIQKLGIEQNSLFANPMFVDIENYDLRLKPDSPALKLGIESIDIDRIGLLDTPAFERIRSEGLLSTGSGSKIPDDATWLEEEKH